MLSSLFLTKLLPEPAYEAYVAAAGIDGSSDFHIDEMYGCPVPPCPGGWDFPSVSSTHLVRVLTCGVAPPRRGAQRPARS